MRRNDQVRDKSIHELNREMQHTNHVSCSGLSQM